ncbi:MAG: Flagellar biosynthetic protein FliP [Phycisphaerae bacterium]|nr:Flagellar biosynthetic protein FliP [Phycisphaerae bacterium]
MRARRALGSAVIVGLVMGSGVGAEASVPGLSSARSATVDNSALRLPDVRGVLPTATDRAGVSSTLQILVLMTVLALVPSILVMTTAFPRIIIVLGLLRQALGTPQLPPGQVLLGLSLFLTMLVMAPTWQKINAEAVTPYFAGDPSMTQQRAIDISLKHLREFMHGQIQQAGNDDDVFLFLEYAMGRPIEAEERVGLENADGQTLVVPTSVLVPAFMLSELKTAFMMGFKIYLPFLVIDMVIASILISMGMMMLPPVLVSLPFKLILFVLAGGWSLVVESLLVSFVV